MNFFDEVFLPSFFICRHFTLERQFCRFNCNSKFLFFFSCRIPISSSKAFAFLKKNFVRVFIENRWPCCAKKKRNSRGQTRKRIARENNQQKQEIYTMNDDVPGVQLRRAEKNEINPAQRPFGILPLERCARLHVNQWRADYSRN